MTRIRPPAGPIHIAVWNISFSFYSSASNYLYVLKKLIKLYYVRSTIRYIWKLTHHDSRVLSGNDLRYPQRHASFAPPRSCPVQTNPVPARWHHSSSRDCDVTITLSLEFRLHLHCKLQHARNSIPAGSTNVVQKQPPSLKLN